MLISYMIVEDSRIDELALLDILEKYAPLNYIATAKDLSAAESLIDRHTPDLIFLDIEMPDGSGIEWAKTIAKPRPAIIFTTSHPDFALEGYEADALDYLVKPLMDERFEDTFKKISEYMELRHLARLQIANAATEHIVFKESYNLVQLPVRDILYLHAMQDYLQIVTARKKYLINYTLGGFLKEYAGYGFVRIHRSFAVLKENILEMSHGKVKVAGKLLPLGKTYRAEVTNVLSGFHL